MDKELSDLIQKEDKLQVTRVDAHRLWKFLEAICEEDSDDEDQEEEEKSLEECSTSETCIHPLVTPPKGQGAKFTESVASLLEPVRPVLVTGQTGLTRDNRRQSKKYSRRRSRQAQPPSRSTYLSEVDHKCLMAKRKKRIKGNEDQRVEAIKALTQDLKKIKLEQASLVHRCNELSNDYANATNSIACVASLEK